MVYQAFGKSLHPHINLLISQIPYLITQTPHMHTHARSRWTKPQTNGAAELGKIEIQSSCGALILYICFAKPGEAISSNSRRCPSNITSNKKLMTRLGGRHKILIVVGALLNSFLWFYLSFSLFFISLFQSFFFQLSLSLSFSISLFFHPSLSLSSLLSLFFLSFFFLFLFASLSLALYLSNFPSLSLSR